MLFTAASALLAALPLASAATLTNESVLGVYMFHRHGDRTPKFFAPTNLTDLGYQEVYQSGEYYRSRYIDTTADYRIEGINPNVVADAQIQASAPIDNVLQNSAMGFLQALYPEVGAALSSQTLANGTTVSAPLNGYQLIPLATVESGSGGENTEWLQSTSGCYKAELSSNEFFVSTEYDQLEAKTMDFYRKLLPVLQPAGWNSSTATFMNAYDIWDYINVGEIHNSSIAHGNLLTNSTIRQLYTLASAHEWGLAYNQSQPIRAIGGSTLGAQVVQFLNATIESAGADNGGKFAVQFGEYASFMSFFGLADLTSVSVDFYGITDYASSMMFEMFTNSTTAVTTSNYPSADEIYVRFLYHNGTASAGSPPIQYPLFGSGQMDLTWNDFVSGMNQFSIGETGQWCTACGNNTGICEGYGSDDSSSSSGSSDGSCDSSGNGLSPAVNGVIGAMVTLAVILGLEALLVLVFGLRVVSKKRLRGVGNGAAVGDTKG